MTTDAVYLRLEATDPRRWHAVAEGWRRWAELAGWLAAEFPALLARVGSAWSGAAATAAVRRLTELRRRLVLFRLRCWQADQAVSEFAAALDRARALLVQAGPAFPDHAAGPPAQAGPAVTVAGRADDVAADRLDRLAAAATSSPPAIPAEQPGCTAAPAEVRRWWGGLSAAQQQWLLATEPAGLASLDGLSAGDRDAANRLLLDDRRAELDRALPGAAGRERRRLLALRHGLDDLTDRLTGTNGGPRAYLLRLDLTEEGRAVVALGDPDHADAVLTQVPGMTSGLDTFDGDLSRAGRVAQRATELGPAAATSAVLWLDYDAPDFVDEAASRRQATAGVPALRRFQEGLRAAHSGPVPARQTVLGHSYGSLLVGEAAAGAGLDADSVVFVGSPGVGVDRAADLHVPAGQVWSSTSRSDVIQYAAVSPGGLLHDLAVAASGHPLLAFGRPGRDLWFGHNPSDPAFGARVFATQPDGGHLGYWDPGRPALDALADITLGRTP